MYCKLVFPPEEIFKLPSLPKSFEELKTAVDSRLSHGPATYTLKYIDSEKELVNLTSSEDFETALLTASAENLKSLKVHVLFNETRDSTPNPHPLIKMSLLSVPSSNFLNKSTDLKAAQAHSSCNECSQDLQNIKYVCPQCPDYKCCSACEEQLSHAHPLLKVRASQSQRLTPSGSPTHGKKSPTLPQRNSEEESKKAPIYSRTSLTKSSNAKKVSYSGRIFLEKDYSSPIHVEARQEFKIKVSVKNTGHEIWPSNVKLVCVNGAYRNTTIKLLPLHGGAKQNLTISIVSPGEAGKYLSQWRIYYEDGEKSRTFGESLFFDTQVREKSFLDNKSLSKSCGVGISKGKRNSLTGFSGFLREEKGSCNDKNVKIALYLNEIFPGVLQEKVVFLESMPKGSEIDMIQIVEEYLIYSIKNQRKALEVKEIKLDHCQEVLVPSS